MMLLLLRLQGPMQSWGTQSLFSVRDTGLEPSRSGVTGLICAALGRPRDAEITDLALLRMGVRVDREGALRSDYHTAQNILRAGGGRKDTELSTRWYLSDAAFLIALQGDNDELLQNIHRALRNPHWPLFLGRKSFVPSAPIWLPNGLIVNGDLDVQLRSQPRLVQPRADDDQQIARIVVEDPLGTEQRQDFPISFALRKFAARTVATHFWPVPAFVQDSPNALPD